MFIEKRDCLEELVAERHRQHISVIAGIMPLNLARFESGSRIHTLLMLQKYVLALGKHIEIRHCDNIEDTKKS